MAEVGIIPPPEGVTPDFYSWTYLQRTLVSVFAVTFVIATLFLGLRLYTAFALVKKLDWDICNLSLEIPSIPQSLIFAVFIVAAWGTSLAFFVAMLLGAVVISGACECSLIRGLARPAGFGRHLWDVTPAQLEGYYDVLLFLAITYLWPPTLTKLAMLVLYLRINPFRPFQVCVYIVGFLIASYTIVFTALFCGPCNPMSVGSGACLNGITISQAVLNIVSDAAMIILPIPMIRRLNMPLKQKVVLGVLIGLGSAVVLVSIARIAYVKAMVVNPDVTWTQAEAAVFSSLELNLGIMCNSLARLRPFVRAHFPSWAMSLGGSETPGEYQHINPNNGPQAWRGDKASHAYQLGVVKPGEVFGSGTLANRTNTIRVTNNYEVGYSPNESTPVRTGSTESILRME
ncbi:hypothetical protein F4776DRAFT_85433 [Hypoxylon sp. NC0597]|nr:hypothetical protein F4776DRAFT_85433 [Hypoxylon sp. NC0597]